jgi:serine/threonine protein kinase
MILNPADKLGYRYRIERLLAVGGTGSVYKALDEKLNRPVAVKLFSSSSEACRREANIAASFSHPNIVSVYDFVQDETAAYLVMEYVEGETLAEMLSRRGYLPIEESVRIAIELTRALGHAHSRGVVHRDLNPNNVMVGYDARIKLMDFGMALKAGIPTKGTSEFGTLAYMPPERLMGRVGDSRCDQYALGVLLYHMLTGTLPFGGDNALAISYRILNGRPRPLRDHNPDVLSRLEKTVMRLLEKDPSRRYRDMAEVRFYLERSRRTSRIPITASLELPSPENLPQFREIQGLIRDAHDEGKGVILILTGGLGAEKMSIINRLREIAPDGGKLLLHSQADASARDYPYYLFRMMLRSLLRTDEIEVAVKSLTRHLSDPDLMPFLLNLAGFSFEEQRRYEYLDLEKRSLRERLHAAFRNWLIHAAYRQPALLILDELQWIDWESLDLLLELFELSDHHPIVFLCSYRPDRESRCNLIEEHARTSYPDRFHFIDIQHALERPVIPHHHIERRICELEGERLGFQDIEWEFYENDGSIEVTEEGGLILKAPVGKLCTFPFVCTTKDPFPQGDFIVRLEMQYLDSRQNGAGFEICRPKPRNLCDPPLGYRKIINIWQDHSGSAHLACKVGGEDELFLESSPALKAHLYEFRFLLSPDRRNKGIYFLFDGKLIFVHLCEDIPRPMTMWFGQFRPDRTSLGWSDFKVNWIEVVPVK